MGKWVWGYAVILSLTLMTAQWGSRAVTVFTETAPPRRQHTIILDAGHGGVDGGAISCTGVPESQFNLQITLRLQEFLQFLGHDTKMIRTEDISVYTKGETIAAKKASDLKERVRMVNETTNGILVSIHQNKFTDSRYSGAQVFYTGNPVSREMAHEIQSALVCCLNPSSTRQEKKSSGIYLMENIKRPGVLIECGFLSNPEEEARLREEYYQKKLCTIIGCTLSEYLSNT